MKIDKTFTPVVLKELEGGLVAPDGTIQGAPTAKQVKKTKGELEDDDEQRYEPVNEGNPTVDKLKHFGFTKVSDTLWKKGDNTIEIGGGKPGFLLSIDGKPQTDSSPFYRKYKRMDMNLLRGQLKKLKESVNEGIPSDMIKSIAGNLAKKGKVKIFMQGKTSTHDTLMNLLNTLPLAKMLKGGDKEKIVKYAMEKFLKHESVNEALYNVGLPKEIEYEKAIGKVVSKLKGIDAYAKMTARYGKAPVNSSANHVYISQYGTVDNTSKLKSILNKLDPNLDISKLKHNFNASDSSRSKHDQDNDIWKYSIPKKMDWHQAKKAGLLKSNPVKKMNHNVVMSLLDMMAQYTSKQHELADQEWTSLEDFMQHASDFIKGGNWKKFQASVKEKYPMLESVNEAVTKLDVSKLSNSVLISLRKGIDKISRKLNSAEIALFYDLVDEMKKRKIKESHDPFKPEYGTGEVVHDCPKHVEVEGIKGKVVGHTLNEQGDVKYIDIDFGMGKVYKNIRTDKVKVLEGQSHQHETKEESTSKTLTKDQLAEIIKEEIKSLDEISGFPNMQKWWKEDPKDVMSFIYWLQKKTPPTGDKWDKAWKEVATYLNKKHKAPSGDFEKIMGESMVNEANIVITGEFEGKPKKFSGSSFENYLKDIAKISKNSKDFVDKIIMGITDETSNISRRDISTLANWYTKIARSVNEASMKKFSLVKIKVGKHKGEEGRIMVYGGPRKHSVVSLDYGEYNFNPKDLELAESVNEAKGSWSLYVDKKKIGTFKSKKAAVIAQNKYLKNNDDWESIDIRLDESVNEARFSESVNRSELKSIIKEEFLNILKEASGGEIFAQFKGTIRKMEAELLNRMDKGGVPEDLEQDVIAVLVKQLTKGSKKISCS